MGLSLFQNAHHFEINDGQFTNIANTTIINNAPNSDPVSKILRKYVATGATFDSAERCPPGRCHAGTRKRIIEQIINWVDDPGATQYIIWLYGPAGSGKSALAQSICELLARTRPERNGASFFFASGLTDRGNAFKLFATISYQLAIHFPSIRAEINKALEHDPTLPTKSMEIQLQSLIIQPLLQCENPPSDHHPVVIIDGLDECGDDEEANTQRDIVSLIARSIVDYKLPLRFFVASRPEYWIRDTFNTAPLPTITLSLSLQNETDANRDIRIYLIDEFEKIRVKNKRTMGSVALPWPPTQVVDHFVYEASGQFIYASTVIRFVGKSSRFSNPLEQLCIITSPGPQRAFAFSELDRLYARILSAYPRWEMMKHVLGVLLVYDGNLTVVKIFLDIDPDELVVVLDALSSLIDEGNTNQSPPMDEMLRNLLSFTSSPQSTRQNMVSFCHLSFLQFLKDETRSGAFYIDVDDFRDEITKSLFGMIHRSIDQGYRSDRCLIFNINFATYLWIMYKVAIESLSDSRIDNLYPLISHMTERLVSLVEFHFGQSRESLVWFSEDMRMLESAIEASIATTTHRKKENSEQSADFERLCEKFRNAVLSAHKRAMHALTLCSELKVTLLLVYFTEFYRRTEWISPTTLSLITGNDAVLLAITQNRHFIHLSYHPSTSSWRLRLVDLEALLANGHARGLRIQDLHEWKFQRAFLVHYLLKSVIEINWYFKLFRAADPNDSERSLILKESFFDSRSMMDICARTHLRNHCKCFPFLRFIGDLHLGRTVRYRPWDLAHGRVPNLITSIICWLNRQLTSQQTLKLIKDHDEALPQKMTATMKYLFENFFIQHFNKSYTGQIYARGGPGEPRKVITLKVLPLPQGSYTKTGEDECYHPVFEAWLSDPLDWHAFHDEVFGKVESPTSSVIDPSRWHPHLTSRLLNVLVKFLYGQVHPMFSISDSWDESAKLKFQKSLSYITECLPFAEPTLENLDALRLIVYLYPGVERSVSSLLPEGIWLSIAAFLERYPRSILSSEELGLFERWLSSQEHLDITKDVAISPSEPAPEPVVAPSGKSPQQTPLSSPIRDSPGREEGKTQGDATTVTASGSPQQNKTRRKKNFLNPLKIFGSRRL